MKMLLEFYKQRGDVDQLLLLPAAEAPKKRRGKWFRVFKDKSKGKAIYNSLKMWP